MLLTNLNNKHTSVSRDVKEGLTVRMYLSWAALLESRAMSSIPWAMVFLVAYRLVFSLDCNREENIIIDVIISETENSHS